MGDTSITFLLSVCMVYYLLSTCYAVNSPTGRCFPYCRTVGTDGNVCVPSISLKAYKYSVGTMACLTGNSEIVCHPLQKPRYGHYNQSTLPLHYPSTLVSSCDAGYQLLGSRAVSTERRCQKDGTWSGAPPYCTGTLCAPLNKPENGHYDHGATLLRYPATATVTCDPGYQVSPSGAVRHCQTDGNWSSPEPQCTGIRCNHLSNPAHSNYHLGPSPVLYPSNVTVTCDPGYRLLRSQSVRTCQTDGTWSGSEPQCTGIVCATLNNPQHGHYDHQTSTPLHYPATATVSCDPEYKVSPSGTARQCLPDGNWSGPEPQCTGISEIVCHPLQKPRYGHYNQSTLPLHYPSTLVSSCDAGYQLLGSRAVRTERRCQKDGTWSGAPPYCTGTLCAPLNKPENGHYDHGATLLRYPATATVTCDPGYQVSPSGAVRHCQTDGNWSSPEPQCTGIRCNHLSNPAHGNYHHGPSPVLYPSNVTVTCDPGYRLLRSQSVRTCQTDGTWSGSEPHCTGIVCANLNSPQNGHYDHGTSPLHYPAAATVTCDPGYQVSPSGTVRNCQTDGSWSGPDIQCSGVLCDTLNTPQHGHYDTGTSPLHYPATATVTCDPGYQVFPSDAVRHCQTDGRWSGSEPHCTGVLCATLHDPKNGHYDHQTPSPVHYPATARVTCDPGYQVSPSGTRIHCQTDGSWSGPEPQCKGVLCATLTKPQNGHYDHGSSSLNYPANATMSCDPGYKESPSGSVRRCQTDGHWSDPEPQCTANPCMTPSNVLHGQYMYQQEGNNTFELMATVEFRCESGYHIRDYSDKQTFTRTCLLNNSWSNKEPKCIANSCPAPGNVENGYYVTEGNTTFDFMTILEFRCDSGYRIDGDDATQQDVFTRACRANQTWSKSDPTCVGILCKALELPLNGRYKEGIQLHRYPAYVTIVCDEGFSIPPSMSNTRLCLRNGSWSEPPSTCTNNSYSRFEAGHGVDSTIIIAAVTSGTLLIIVVGIIITYILRARPSRNLGRQKPDYGMRGHSDPDESAYSTIDHVAFDFAKGKSGPNNENTYLNAIL